jgi:hypothetical protein
MRSLESSPTDSLAYSPLVDATAFIGGGRSLTDKMYDYDLTSKGIYYVTISKKVASLEKEKTIEFVLSDIEIQVK